MNLTVMLSCSRILFKVSERPLIAIAESVTAGDFFVYTNLLHNMQKTHKVAI